MSIQSEINRISSEVTTQTDLLGQIAAELAGKAAGGDIEIQTDKEAVTPSNVAQTVWPDSGYVALAKVTVKAIPSPYFDTSAVTAGEDDVVTGKKIVSASGETIAGTNPYDKAETDEEVSDQSDLLDLALAALEGKAAGGGNAEPEYKKLYQRVEYIESAEEETYPYIVTDFVADNSCGMEVVASFPMMQDRIPMGSRENSGATRFYCVYPLSASSIYYGFNNGTTISCSLSVDTIYRLQTNFLNSRMVNAYDEDGIRKGGGSISATLTAHSVPLAIFGYNSAASGAVTSKREFKLYSARCSRGHEVVREYIPCYRKSDGAVGLYEKFTGQFLLPETGAFAKGADIDWEV